MMNSSKANCCAIIVSSHITKHCQAQNDDAQHENHHFIKEAAHGHFQMQPKRGGGPKPPPNLIQPSPPPPLPLPSTEMNGGINKGWFLFLLHVFSLFMLCFI